MSRLFASLCATFTLLSTACASTQATPPAPAPVGEYRGTVTLEGAERPAELSLIPRDDGIYAVLQVKDETLAFGRAEWLDGSLYIGFDYGRSMRRPCEGRMHLVATPRPDELKLAGQLHARDCTGSVRGSFDLGLYSGHPTLRTESLTPHSSLR